MPRLIIFDYDGTLCSTHDAISHALAGLFRERAAMELDPARVSDLIGQGLTLHQTLRELHPAGGRFSDAELDDWRLHYRDLYRESAADLVEPFPAAVETVAACAEVAPVAVVSQKGIEALEHSLQQLGMRGSVQRVFGDDGQLPKKPDPALYTGAIRAAFPDSRPESTLMIGDTAADLQFAKSAGIRSCWAEYGYGGDQACRSVGYDFQISALAELLPIVQGLPA